MLKSIHRSGLRSREHKFIPKAQRLEEFGRRMLFFTVSNPKAVAIRRAAGWKFTGTLTPPL